MNRSGRMFAIVVDLEARRIVRAEDRAARYETSVRTIYRDISALCEAGIPVVSLPGQGYALPPDYFLPPLSFGVDEAGALLLGAAMSQRRSIPRIGQRHRAPRPKIEAIGPDAVWQAFPSPATLAAADETELAAVLHHTVAGRRVAACARAFGAAGEAELRAFADAGACGVAARARRNRRLLAGLHPHSQIRPDGTALYDR
jgi:predicted DNA-binding transcriptional regulator YafY